MKRRFSEIHKDLTIKSPAFLPCEICSKKVFNYKTCTQPYTYCSQDCLEVLLLSQKNNYLDTVDEDSFMKRIKKGDEIDKMEVDEIKN